MSKFFNRIFDKFEPKDLLNKKDSLKEIVVEITFAVLSNADSLGLNGEIKSALSSVANGLRPETTVSNSEFVQHVLALNYEVTSWTTKVVEEFEDEDMDKLIFTMMTLLRILNYYTKEYTT